MVRSTGAPQESAGAAQESIGAAQESIGAAQGADRRGGLGGPANGPRMVTLGWVVALFAATWIYSMFDIPDLHNLSFLLLSAIQILPLLLRNEYPRAVFAFVAGGAFLQSLADIEPMPGNAAVLVAMYTVARHLPLAWAVPVGVVTELGVLMESDALFWPYPGFDLGSLLWTGRGNLGLALMLLVATVWLAGRYFNTRGAYQEGLAERAHHVQVERVQQAQISAAGERARIARELHDVVAHNVSVIVVHAEGGRQALDQDPQQTRHALDTIWTTGRQVLAEMRRIIGVLRAEDDDAGDVYAPQPGIAELDQLVEHVRASGVHADLTVRGTSTPLSTGLQLAIYRIVQESLTNVLKHAGPGATARVLLEYQGDEVMVEVSDDGKGALTGGGPGRGGVGPGATAEPAPGYGLGLLGMRERVALYGGMMEAGHRPAGGYRVRAHLPVIAGVENRPSAG